MKSYAQWHPRGCAQGFTCLQWSCPGGTIGQGMALRMALKLLHVWEHTWVPMQLWASSPLPLSSLFERMQLGSIQKSEKSRADRSPLGCWMRSFTAKTSLSLTGQQVKGTLPTLNGGFVRQIFWHWAHQAGKGRDGKNKQETERGKEKGGTGNQDPIRALFLRHSSKGLLLLKINYL